MNRQDTSQINQGTYYYKFLLNLCKAENDWYILFLTSIGIVLASDTSISIYITFLEFFLYIFSLMRLLNTPERAMSLIFNSLLLKYGHIEKHLNQ